MTAAGGRTVLITGAARRIGRELALDFAGRGYKVGVHYNGSEAEATEVVDLIEAIGETAVALQADLADMSAVESLMPRCIEALGVPTCLVNNASRFHYDDIAGLTQQSWDRHQAINLRAAVFLARAFAHALPEKAKGTIVNIIDQRVLKPTPHFLSYAVSKSGLWAATQMLAQALAPRIRVNAIGPGPVLRSIHQSEAEFAAQCQATLLERGTTPAEIAAAVRFILEAPALTGQMLALDGGQHLAWRTPDATGAEGKSVSPPSGRSALATPVTTRGQRRVLVNELAVMTVIGIHPHEKQAPQRVLVSIDMSVRETGAPGADRIEDVVDYEAVVKRVRAIAAAGGVVLVETLAERIAGACLADRRVAAVRVKVEKPDVFADARSVGIEIERVQSLA